MRQQQQQQHDVTDDVTRRLSAVLHETLCSAACHGHYTLDRHRHCMRVLSTGLLLQATGSAIAEGPRDAPCQLLHDCTKKVAVEKACNM